MDSSSSIRYNYTIFARLRSSVSGSFWKGVVQGLQNPIISSCTEVGKHIR